MEANKELLDNQAFQGLRDDLSNLDTAVATLSTVKEKNKNLLKKLNDQVFFAKNASGKNIESPVLIAGNAIAGKNPTRDLRNLSRTAKASKDPESALGGLYSSILEYAMTKAGGTSQAFSPRAFYDTVFSEMPNALRRTNLAEMMVSNGIATQKQMDSVKKFVTELVKFEAMEAAGKFGGEDLVDNINGVLGFYLKISGASVGQFIASKMPLPGSRGMGTGLIESQAGVQIMENIFRDVPQSMKMDVMAELMADPVRLAQMLQKVRTQQQAKTTFESLSNWLRSSGFKPIKRITPSVIREVDEEITGPEFEFEESSVNLPNEGFPTTQTATVPQSGVNNRLAANVGTAPQAAPNLNQRQQFASLFPNDPISGLINAQQPTRLMAEGGDVSDLREAPEVDDLRALTLEEFKEATLKHLLELQDKKDRAYEKYVAPRKGVILENVFGGSGIRLNPAFLEEAQQLEQEMKNFGTDRQKAITNYEDVLREGKMVSMRSAKDIEEGNVIIRGFPDYLVNPVKNMRQGGAVPPRQVDIKGQPHMLAYITPQEGGILQLLGGSGAPGPMGIPSFFGPGGPGDDGSDEADPSGPGTESPSSGGDTGYSGSISDAIAASTPSAGPGVGIGDMSNITNMGLDSSIANMAAAMAGLSRGVKNTENVQGSINYAPVKNVPYDLFNLKSKMNKK